MPLQTQMNSREGITEINVYDSLTEFLDLIPDNQIKEFIESRGLSTSFVGRDMSTNAKRKAIEAYEHGLRVLDESRDEVRGIELPRPKTRSRRARFDEFNGDEICLDRLRSGAPYWRTTRRESTTGAQNLTIAIDIAANGAATSRSIAWRGVAGILIAELLESSGIRVELWAFERSARAYTNGNDFTNLIKLKSADCPLDLVSLVNATSGWFFRSFGFYSLALSAAGSTPSPGLGCVKQSSATDLTNETGIGFDAIVTNCNTREACIEIVESIISKFCSVAA